MSVVTTEQFQHTSTDNNIPKLDHDIVKKIAGLCALSAKLVSNDLKQPVARSALQKHKMLRCNKTSCQYM